MMNELRGRADLHIHSAVGDGLATVAQILDYVEHRTELDLIAITDHDEVRGALQARELAAAGSRRFEVIVGTEITTRQGHLLAYDVDRRYPMLRSLRDSIAAVHDDGGFVVVPHPLSFLTTSAGRIALCRAVDCADARQRPDAIELFNPSLAGRVRHRRAIELNRRLGLAESGGSDAHHLELVGTAWTTFPGRTAGEFRAAIAARATAAAGGFWTLGDHMHGLAEQQWRSMVLAPSQKLLRAVRRPG
jgi:predicted metal-dependent phosphoesterase TrpH